MLWRGFEQILEFLDYYYFDPRANFIKEHDQKNKLSATISFYLIHN